MGWLQTTLLVRPFSPNDLRLRVDRQPALVFLTGRIAGSAELQSPEQNAFVPPRWQVHLDAESIQPINLSKPAVPVIGRVLIFGKGRRHTHLWAGTKVRVAGVLAQPANARAPGIFDYREKLRRDGIHYQVNTTSDSDWEILSQPQTAPLAARFRQWAREQFSAGMPAEDESLRLLWAMVLGWRTALTDEVAEPFMRSGTMHIFAISGLHIALISGILVTLLRVCRLGRLACGLIVIPLLWFYCAATGFQASATRATLMMSIVIGGWALERPTNLLNSTCAAAYVILLWNPLQLMQASFQLSFSVVFTIALLMPKITAWGDRLIHLDPLRPESETPRMTKLTIWLGRQAWSLVAISFAAWLGSMPLIAYYFHLWTPGALLANPIIVLLATAAIGSAIGGLLTSLICPPMGELFNHSAWFWVHSQASISRFTSELPGSWWQIAQTSLPETAAAYLLIIGGGVDRLRTGWLRIAYAAGIIALLTTALTDRMDRSTRTELAIFSDNSNSIFWNPPGRANDLLIDCGRSNAFAKVVVPYLHARGILRVENFLLTHGDINHVEAFELARSTFSPRHIAVSPVPQRSPTYQRLTKSLATDHQPTSLRMEVSRGTKFVGWEVVHPSPTFEFRRADDSVVVLSGTVHGWRILLLSDASPQVQQRLLESGRDLRCDVIVVGISDPESILEDDFLRASQPEVIVAHDNPVPVQDRLQSQHLSSVRAWRGRILRTSQTGSVVLKISPDGIDIEAAIGHLGRIPRH